MGLGVGLVTALWGPMFGLLIGGRLLLIVLAIASGQRPKPRRRQRPMY